MRKLKKSELKRVYGAGHNEDTNPDDSANSCDSDYGIDPDATLDSDKHECAPE